MKEKTKLFLISFRKNSFRTTVEVSYAFRSSDISFVWTTVHRSTVTISSVNTVYGRRRMDKDEMDTRKFSDARERTKRKQRISDCTHARLPVKCSSHKYRQEIGWYSKPTGLSGWRSSRIAAPPEIPRRARAICILIGCSPHREHPPPPASRRCRGPSSRKSYSRTIIRLRSKSCTGNIEKLRTLLPIPSRNATLPAVMQSIFLLVD